MEKDKNIWLWVIIGIVILLVLSGGFGMSYGMMGFGWLFMILFWGIIIWLVITLISTHTKKEDVTEKPLDIVKKRYAKGEINKKEFESMKKELV